MAAGEFLDRPAKGPELAGLLQRTDGRLALSYVSLPPAAPSVRIFEVDGAKLAARLAAARRHPENLPRGLKPSSAHDLAFTLVPEDLPGRWTPPCDQPPVPLAQAETVFADWTSLHIRTRTRICEIFTWQSPGGEFVLHSQGHVLNESTLAYSATELPARVLDIVTAPLQVPALLALAPQALFMPYHATWEKDVALVPSWFDPRTQPSNEPAPAGRNQTFADEDTLAPHAATP